MPEGQKPRCSTVAALQDALDKRIDDLEKYLVDRIQAVMDINLEREERNKERFAEMKDAVASALSSADKAVSKSETANERRFDSVNEFRATLQDQQNTFLPRLEYNAQHKAIMDLGTASSLRIERLEARTQGKSEGLGIVGSLALGITSVLSVIVAIAAVVMSVKH
jgi:hypothetical protein